MFGPIYLDEIHYYDHGDASTAQLAAFASGQVDAIYEFDIASYAMAESIPSSTIYEAQTAQTGVLRMKITQPPFTDHRVRRAVQLCCDAAVYLSWSTRAVPWPASTTMWHRCTRNTSRCRR